MIMLAATTKSHDKGTGEKILLF